MGGVTSAGKVEPPRPRKRQRKKPRKHYGLLDKKTQRPCTLKAVSVTARIIDLCARVEIKQSYENTLPVPLETIYTFNATEDEAVCGLEIMIDDVKLFVEVKENEEALNEYEDTISSGQTAALLEKDVEDPNNFRLSLGNVPPGAKVQATLTYVTILEARGSDVYFILREELFPMTDYDLNIDVTVKFLTSTIEKATSPTGHEISSEGSEIWKIKYTNLPHKNPLVSDFVVAITTKDKEKENKPAGLMEEDTFGDKTRRAVMATFYPRWNNTLESIFPNSKNEFVFLIDRSNSMYGSKFNESRDALLVFLHSLPPDSYFNVIGYGTKYLYAFWKSKKYSEKSLRNATNFVLKMYPDGGGTNILSPLKFVYRKKSIPNYPLQVFVLLDGDIDNTKPTLSLIRKNRYRGRTFALGLGSEVDVELIQGIARAGRGTYEIVSDEDVNKLTDIVMKQLKEALQPALKDIQIKWGDLNVKTAPYHISPCFSGERLIVFGLVSDTKKEEEKPKSLGESQDTSIDKSTEKIEEEKPKEEVKEESVKVPQEPPVKDESNVQEPQEPPVNEESGVQQQQQQQPSTIKDDSVKSSKSPSGKIRSPRKNQKKQDSSSKLKKISPKKPSSKDFLREGRKRPTNPSLFKDIFTLFGTDSTGKIHKWTAEVTVMKKQKTVNQLAAFKRIIDLENGRSEYHEPKAMELINDLDDIVAAEVTLLSMRYNIPSKFTSFIAKDERDNLEATLGSMEKEVIPTVKEKEKEILTKGQNISYALPSPPSESSILFMDESIVLKEKKDKMEKRKMKSNYAKSSRRHPHEYGDIIKRSAFPPPPPPSQIPHIHLNKPLSNRVHEIIREDSSNDEDDEEDVQDSEVEDDVVEELIVPKKNRPSVTVAEVISLQSVNGGWTMQYVSIITNIPIDELKKAHPVNTKDLKDDAQELTIWATVLAIAFLKMKFAGKQSEWEISVYKSDAFLRTTTTKIDDWMEKASSFLEKKFKTDEKIK